MIFLNSFLSLETSFNPVATNVSNINHITLKNGIYDDLLVTKDTEYTYSNVIVSTWDMDTIFHALFNGDLKAGNVDFTAQETSHLRIKRRPINTFDWQTIEEIKVNSVEDLTPTWYDYLNASNVEYEYAIVPVINGIEGNISKSSVLSKFNGIFVVDRNHVIHSEMNIVMPVQRNRPTDVKTPLGRRYSTVIGNSNNNFDSGSVSATFIELDTKLCKYKVDDGVNYRRWVMDFLTDGKPKVLKDWQGRMWLCAIVGNPSEDSSQTYKMPVTRFEWTEIGDYKSSRDLYMNGLIDIDQNVMVSQ